MSYAFWGASLFFLVAGVATAWHSNRRMEEVRLSFSVQTNGKLYQAETERMERVVATGYRSAYILFSTLVVGGLVVVLTHSYGFWKGIGLGLLMMGTTGHAIEAISLLKNKAYQQKIEYINVKGE